ncbi:MAG: hypothetical protein ABI765_16370 [Gemmatimonadota bacterium]
MMDQRPHAGRPIHERDVRLGAVLREGGAGVPEHEMDWDRLAQRVSARARRVQRAASDWSAALPVRLPAIAASLLIMASAALLAGEVAWSDRIAIAPVAAERLAMDRILSTQRDEETFGLLFNAAGADLFEYWGDR